MAQSLIEIFNSGFYIGAEKVEIGGSIGIASYPVYGETTDALLVAADKAMYRLKKKGTTNFEIYK